MEKALTIFISNDEILVCNTSDKDAFVTKHFETRNINDYKVVTRNFVACSAKALDEMIRTLD